MIVKLPESVIIALIIFRPDPSKIETFEHGEYRSVSMSPVSQPALAPPHRNCLLFSLLTDGASLSCILSVPDPTPSAPRIGEQRSTKSRQIRPHCKGSPVHVLRDMEKNDALNEVKPSSPPPLINTGETIMSKFIKNMAYVRSFYNIEIRNLVKKHQLSERGKLNMKGDIA